MSLTLSKLLLVFIGGGIGATLRYSIYLWLPFGYWTTLGINVLGSFWVGILAGLSNHHVFLLLVIGILGGFTTFSTFQLEILKIIQDGAFYSSMIYIILSVLLGFLAVAGGFALSKYLI